MRADGRDIRGRLVAALCGVVLCIATRECVNASVVPDWLVQPLVVEDRTEPSAEAVVVLGAGVSAFCTPNPPGIERTLRGVRELRASGAPVVVFSGGQPAGSPCTVAEAMGHLATALGVRATEMRVETASSTTWENAVRTDAILRARRVKRIRLVTDALHMMRAKACFTQFGYEVSTASVPPALAYRDNVNMLTMAGYETLAYAYYTLAGRIGSARHPRVEEESAIVSNPPMPPSGATAAPGTSLVVFGASYAKSWPLTGVAGIEVLNRGVAGNQTHEMLDRFQRDVVEAKPRAVLIWGFINDVFRTPRPQMTEGIAKTRENLLTMVRASRTAGITPILATEVTLSQPAGVRNWVGTRLAWLRGRETYADFINRHVLDTNEWIRELGAAEGVAVVDIQRAMQTRGGYRHRDFSAEDGSHITPAGYDALSAYAVPRLETLLSQASTALEP